MPCTIQAAFLDQAFLEDLDTVSGRSEGGKSASQNVQEDCYSDSDLQLPTPSFCRLSNFDIGGLLIRT